MQRPPLSPLSMSSNDSSFVGQYGSLGGTATGTPNDVPYGSGGPYGAARPLQSSPPSSQHPSGSTDISRPSASGSSIRPPSSASSVGMSSDGRMGLPRPPNRESSRSQIAPNSEDALSRHYVALRSYLAESLQDEKGNPKPNRARDKLLRLSVTQFMELSTDVYDELIRREDERLQRVENVPRFLLPKQNFHPKRNQARQKLSTLPTERFRQLATDVFYELERRIPRFAGGDISRPLSSVSNVSSRSRAPTVGGMRPPGPGYGGPPGPGMMGRGGGPPTPRLASNGAPYGPNGGVAPGARRPSEAASLGRPLPKQFASNTIVPNKSTMVEDDDADDDEDAFGLDHVSRGMSDRYSKATSAEERDRMKAQAEEILELKEKLDALENKLVIKDQELAKISHIEAERGEWVTTREGLERKNVEAQTAHDALQQELSELKSRSRDHDELRDQHDRSMADFQEQLDDLGEQLAAKHEENGKLQLQLREGAEDTAALQQLHVELDELRHQLQTNKSQASSAEQDKQMADMQEELRKQQKLNQEVQDQAMVYLREMRELSRQNDEAIEQEEKMAAQIAQLQKDNESWRQRYAKVKAQNKHLRASTMGLGLHTGIDTGSLVRQEGLISEGGLVRDTDVASFQLAVDELLKVARGNSTENMLDSVKSVVVSVQSITAAVRDEGYPSPAPSPLSPGSSAPTPSVGKLKARVTGTANSLITATKQHAASHGLSPVALLDAAASNLTAAVVELIKSVRIRPSTKSEFQDLEAVDELQSFYDDGLSPIDGGKGLQIPVPQFGPRGDSVQAVQQPPIDSSPASGKKPSAGWFGWAGKWGDGSTEDHPQVDSKAPSANGAPHPPVTVNGHAHKASIASSGSDYDPYR
ncbi:Putative SHD domain, protein Spa2/Sph1 [Septoria linicola]|uniref:SHD domain, protein Spa2/Sph1 n=1 Tax=Septoria linicola TaxID=215465 RepID=A0A9Q9AQL8_9PEZI|nr:Putative SHD domain, protein Spa2/Sph1 [Septoria linicola]